MLPVPTKNSIHWQGQPGGLWPTVALGSSEKNHKKKAKKENLAAGDSAHVTQGDDSVILPVLIDDSIPDGCVWIPSGVPGSEKLGPACGSIEVAKA